MSRSDHYTDYTSGAFQEEEKNAKWRYDNKYKMAISWLECVENTLAGESGMKGR